MLTSSEKDYIYQNAYIPEHIADYVAAVSEAEPFLINDFICYRSNDFLVFNGYPLNGVFEELEMKKALDAAIGQFQPAQIVLIASSIPQLEYTSSKSESDAYYRLELANMLINQKVRNMIKHATRKLHCEKSRSIKDEHRQLISEFLTSRELDEAARYLFNRIPEYISAVSSSIIFEARNSSGKLIAFDIAEFGARNYAFYMFNFRSQKDYAPGASDILLYEIINAAKDAGKLFINLGLGINKGVIFFKKKWGAAPFLAYKSCNYNLSEGREFAFLKFLKEKIASLLISS